ncbi:PAS domain-containing protein [Rhodococcus qingshengii]|uniref:PAS domain-containing protein n=1 Tax=Rhodococcus qingshengii TaxID=334542 RepID=UPI001BE7EF4F|nr:PAS domain-containing protein [Rhodococcus qingshengii]
MTNERMRGVSESGAPHRVGGFRYSRAEDEWEWSDNVAAMHGYRPGEVVPTTELLLSHKHPDDRQYVSQTLDAIRTSGGPFSSRQRIVDTNGVTRSVVVVGQSDRDDNGEVSRVRSPRIHHGCRALIASTSMSIEASNSAGGVVRSRAWQ